jgi:hypothetical protein
MYKDLFFYFVCYLYSQSTFILHSRSLICLLRLFPLFLVNLHFTSSKLHFFVFFTPFAPYPLSFWILEASFLYFVCSFCSLPTSILHPWSFNSLFRSFPLLHANLHFISLKLYLSVFFTPFAPFASCLPLFCILKASSLYFVCSLYSMSTLILHPWSFFSLLCLLPLLPTHFYFASSKLHFYALFFFFAPYPPPFCIMKVLFVCFVCSVCTLLTSILYCRNFISLLCLFSLFPAHLYFASLKLHFSTFFASFVLYPPPFCILEASCVCFICSLSTSIFHPRSFMCLLRLLSLLCLFSLFPANFHFKKRTWLWHAST